jgi:hypothetical protein
MATLNIETKVASLQAEKSTLEVKITDYEIKVNDFMEKLRLARVRKEGIESIITELTN